LAYKKKKNKVVYVQIKKFIDFDYVMDKYDILSKEENCKGRNMG
jgi:hypothetical protein